MKQISAQLKELYNNTSKHKLKHVFDQYIKSNSKLQQYIADNALTLIDVIYSIAHNINIEPWYCLQCGKQVHAKLIAPSYTKPLFCCIQCHNKSDYHKIQTQKSIENWSDEKREQMHQKRCEQSKRIWDEIMTPEKIKQRTHKIEQTCLERYGEINFSKTDEGRKGLQNRNKAYYLNPDNKINIMQRVEKWKNTFANKSDEEKARINKLRGESVKRANANKTEEEKRIYEQRRIQTCLERYGVAYPLSNSDIRHKAIETKKNNPKSRYRSNKEKALYDALKCKIPTLEHNRWNILYDKGVGPRGTCRELDIVLREKKMGIEFNGTYWHRHDPQSLHKQELCKQIGWKLLVVQESDWDENKDAVIEKCIKFLLS